MILYYQLRYAVSGGLDHAHISKGCGYSRVSVPVSGGEIHRAQSSQFLLLLLDLPLEEGHWGICGHMAQRRDGGRVSALRGQQQTAVGVHAAVSFSVQGQKRLLTQRWTSSHSHRLNGQDLTDVLQHLTFIKHVLISGTWRLEETGKHRARVMDRKLNVKAQYNSNKHNG